MAQISEGLLMYRVRDGALAATPSSSSDRRIAVVRYCKLQLEEKVLSME